MLKRSSKLLLFGLAAGIVLLLSLSVWTTLVQPGFPASADTH